MRDELADRVGKARRSRSRPIYDLLVAPTVEEAGARLLTRVRRAVPAYDAVGIDYELLG